MSGDQPASTPDLQAILATLSQFTNPAPTPVAAPPVASEPSSTNYYDVSQALLPEPASQLLPASKPQDPRLRPQSRAATASPKPMIDPATIITWQEGLRCLTKIAAQNAQFAVVIRGMIDDQKKHELRWYADRQALKHLQVTHSSASAQAQSILQSLGSAGGRAPTGKQTQSEKDDELADFDRKIYAAQVSMEAAMTGQLKGLGVPFFGTRSEMVVPDVEQDLSAVRSVSGLTITESELLALRRKIVGHLEDLYRD
ncbi:hypothetical protein LTR91_008871 [Friedmanniomyces endolithicus]|uniref:Uncharacterized protein n=1 Tax=Friedmanniomyces endolithicus TaxID=329885 RepID=A0AAN6KNP4_9PEZI|nr:hypothetical protein LTR94_006104 [Friedmanniomyces endolithicus]KAK0802524.1 hypothetical protein LTR59_004962 [Friedmanniomyces endolithicus]KAK0812872.1 hypothetical protein LTR75_004820 [Friedmanniomyces endolithicus]KAK0818893.1 hypothetical protein LTR38_000993 [Friedmanniomyces endolithicus]KAK0842956.1 hypothetical protein LTS02_016292 [Friedmanniomyces endolithicus]